MSLSTDLHRLATTPPPPLAVTRLTLSNFRNYEFARLSVPPAPVILTGLNGAGKTNILEALSLLTPGRGMRRARVDELARHDIPRPALDDAPIRSWGIAATVETALGPVDIGTGRDDKVKSGTRERRLVRIEGETARSQSVLGDYIDVLWLTPQMDRLFLDGTTARRRFLDRLIYGFDPSHASRINAYEHTMRERAKLLKTGQRDDRWLSALEDQMATKALAVAAARKDIGNRLNQLAQQGHGPFPGATLHPRGLIEDGLDHRSALEVEDQFRSLLAQSREIDAKLGGAKEGVHKSDLVVRHVEKQQNADQCSTGEQKALLTGIILANAKALALDRGRIPLLLLDEVGAHLDDTRRAALFEAILDLKAQAWLSGTDVDAFKPLADAATFLTVEHGSILQSPTA